MLFFVDESGYDHQESPYEVLASIAIHEKDLWGLIQAIQNTEKEIFGVILSDYCVEFKGKKLLKKKVFRHSQQLPTMEFNLRRTLCKQFLEKGKRESSGGATEIRTKQEFAAYGQSVIDFIEKVLDLCDEFHVKVFASIVSPDAPNQRSDFLRKDYSYLFERFFYYCEDFSQKEMGIVVFDELEKAKCRILINQMVQYFCNTHHGRVRSARIIPEPFFVHSDLTTAVQLVDIIAYCLNWGCRLQSMRKETRNEIEPFAQKAKALEYLGTRPNQNGESRPVYGITYIKDLRPRSERRAGS